MMTDELKSAGSRVQSTKRDSIVLAAKDIFLAQGYSGTSMANVAARLGGSKATLYCYFSSKEQLFAAVVLKICEHNAVVFSSLDCNTGDFRVALRQFGRAIVRLVLSDELVEMHRLIIAEVDRFPEIGDAYYQTGILSGKEKLAHRFAAAIGSGHLRPVDPFLAAQHFVDLCLSDLHHRRLCNITPSPDDAEINLNVEHAVAAFLDGHIAKGERANAIATN